MCAGPCPPGPALQHGPLTARPRPASAQHPGHTSSRSSFQLLEGSILLSTCCTASPQKGPWRCFLLAAPRRHELEEAGHQVFAGPLSLTCPHPPCLPGSHFRALCPGEFQLLVWLVSRRCNLTAFSEGALGPSPPALVRVTHLSRTQSSGHSSTGHRSASRFLLAGLCPCQVYML